MAALCYYSTRLARSKVSEDIMQNVKILKETTPDMSRVLTPDALDFVATLHRAFNPTREQRLRERAERQAAWDSGKRPDFLPDTESVRGGSWLVASTPPDLQDRRVEITGPCERKMMINALNSGAKVFMADLED